MPMNGGGAGSYISTRYASIFNVPSDVNFASTGLLNGASLICSNNRPSGMVSASTLSMRGTRLRSVSKMRSSLFGWRSARY